jgi:Ca2+-binding RTX toxin-like protein
MQATWWIRCAAVCGIGCAAAPEAAPHRAIDGIDEISQPLSDLSAQCVFTPATRVLVLTLKGGDIAVIARASDGAIAINNLACGAATQASVQRIDVREAASGDQVVILDYGGGSFAVGRSGAPGVTIDLGGQPGDALKLIGTPGADGFVAGASGLAINGDAFLDVTVTGAPALVISLDDGDDTLSGAGNATTGAALGSALTVFGGNGNDTLRGGNGDDTLHGGNGNDTFTTGALADGNDTVLGDAGTDLADYAARTGAVTVTIDDLANDGRNGENGENGQAGETDNIGTDVETVKGGLGDDVLGGGPGNETVFGGPGDDTISGGDGNDVLNGEAGNDTFDEGALPSGADVLNGGAGIDTASYAARSGQVSVALDGAALDGAVGELDKVMVDVENVTGGAGIDTLTGSALDNVLDGGAGNDTLAGGLGNDTLRGGADNDTLNGDAGNDTFDEAADTGADTLVGGAGTDTADYHARTGDLVIILDGTSPGGESGESDHLAADIENLIGGSGADALTGNALDNQLEGGPGAAIDALFGLAGDDVLDGGEGDDALDCGAGDADLTLDRDLTSSTTSCEL